MVFWRCVYVFIESQDAISAGFLKMNQENAQEASVKNLPAQPSLHCLVSWVGEGGEREGACLTAAAAGAIACHAK